jgi:hypothetical protein
MATFSLSMVKSQSLECGECKECCVHFSLPAAADFWPQGKPAGQPCQFLGQCGCTIHDQPRPKVCGDFICEWRAGVFGSSAAEWRPDRCGLIFNQLELDVLLRGKLAALREQNMVPPHWRPDNLSLGIVETRPRALLEMDRFRLQYRLDKARLRPTMIAVTPHGFDALPDGKRGMRFDRRRSIGVWSDDNPDHLGYAEAVCEWWDGVASRMAA